MVCVCVVNTHHLIAHAKRMVCACALRWCTCVCVCVCLEGVCCLVCVVRSARLIRVLSSCVYRWCVCVF